MHSWLCKKTESILYSLHCVYTTEYRIKPTSVVFVFCLAIVATFIINTVFVLCLYTLYCMLLDMFWAYTVLSVYDVNNNNNNNNNRPKVNNTCK